MVYKDHITERLTRCQCRTVQAIGFDDACSTCHLHVDDVALTRWAANDAYARFQNSKLLQSLKSKKYKVEYQEDLFGNTWLGITDFYVEAMPVITAAINKYKTISPEKEFKVEPMKSGCNQDGSPILPRLWYKIDKKSRKKINLDLFILILSNMLDEINKGTT